MVLLVGLTSGLTAAHAQTVMDLDMAGLAEGDEGGTEDPPGPGGFVPLNNDDDDNDGVVDSVDTNGVVGENDLVPLTLSYTPSGLNVGRMVLGSTSTKVRFWADSQKQSLVSPLIWFLANGERPPGMVYAEGVAISEAPKDVQLSFNYHREMPPESPSDTIGVTVTNYRVQAAIAPAAIPRDTVTTATVTATVTRGGSPVSGKTVAFTIASGPGAVTQASAQTNAQGQATTQVKASTIAEGAGGNATVTVRAGCEGAFGDANVTVRGLNMTLTSQWPKIYIANPSWRKDTTLTCTVKDTADTPASGSVTFQTTQGSFTGTNPAPLNGQGVATIVLSPGNGAFTNTATSVMSPISKTVQVKFADHITMWTEVNPHKQTPAQNYAYAKIRDQDGALIPGATVTFAWEVAINVEDSDAIPTPTGDPPPDTPATSVGPTPSGSGWGTLQITTARLALPQAMLKHTPPAQWTLQYLEPEGLSIKTDWEANGAKFGASLDQSLKFAIKVTKSF